MTKDRLRLLNPRFIWIIWLFGVTALHVRNIQGNLSAIQVIAIAGSMTNARAVFASNFLSMATLSKFTFDYLLLFVSVINSYLETLEGNK